MVDIDVEARPEIIYVPDEGTREIRVDRKLVNGDDLNDQIKNAELYKDLAAWFLDGRPEDMSEARVEEAVLNRIHYEYDQRNRTGIRIIGDPDGEKFVRIRIPSDRTSGIPNATVEKITQGPLVPRTVQK
jgi:hypothetical protein